MDHQLTRRLQLIETYLFYWGRVQRKDLCRHFDIGAVTASRVLKSYVEQYPGNIEFDVSKRAYVKSASFVPNFEIEVELALELLAYGIESRPLENKTYGPTSISSLTAPLTPKFVGAITRAMVSSEGLEIRYTSTSGEKERTVYPHSIFQSGPAWYFRAYDSDNSEFRTFRFSRVVAVVETSDPIEMAQEKHDHEWNTEVVLTLSPHNQHPSREALAMDLGLAGRPVANYSIRSAIAGFALTDLRVDCSCDGSLDPFEYPLQLQNHSELIEVESMLLAPGFTPSK